MKRRKERKNKNLMTRIDQKIQKSIALFHSTRQKIDQSILDSEIAMF